MVSERKGCENKQAPSKFRTEDIQNKEQECQQFDLDIQYRRVIWSIRKSANLFTLSQLPLHIL